MSTNNFHTQGLTDAEVNEAREKFGSNKLEYKSEIGFIEALLSLAKEPMVILLLVTSSIYFISGKTSDGIFLASAIVLVSAISLYQDRRSRNALAKLKSFSEPTCKVIRNGEVVEIKSEELVIGDSMMVEEGTPIPADGIITHSNDFSVNESILTGESLPVEKDKTSDKNSIYLGTNVVTGLAIATITAIGNETQLGKIGKSIESIKEEKTPLELQIGNFVKKMVIAGALVFVVVWVVNYMHSKDFLDSLLKALTLAMSILPEEIPVAFTTFMAMGAWRLMKMGILVKQMKTIETLGSATVICVDKTGTITENKMQLARLYVLEEHKISKLNEKLNLSEKELISLAMWASEPIPFDPMEVAIHDAYAKEIDEDERGEYKIVHEYPLGGKPPMMTHVFKNQNQKRIIAAKGAPEALMDISKLTESEKKEINDVIVELAAEGYRLLAVAQAEMMGNDYPKTQQEFDFHFLGLVAFYDPPKQNIRTVFEDFYRAGISIKIITGDNTITTKAIASQIGFKGYENGLTGDEVLEMGHAELQKAVVQTNLFTRMFPEAKLKVITALKANNDIVAMTGDGVNDGPALKASHIGIAMGKKGTEIAKHAASLILIEDDLSKMVDAIAMGRRIYTNLKKAIQYIISIHIPIILTVFIPLALGWTYPNIFSPIHIIFLELIMGPTCSIIFENEPSEKNSMDQKPRPFSITFFYWKELTTSIVQGLMITIATLITYQYAVAKSFNEEIVRTMVFSVLIFANIFLTLVNRSFFYSIFTTIRYKNNLVLIIILATLGVYGLILYINPLAKFFQFEQLNLSQIGLSLGMGFVFVMWYEVVKWMLRRADTKIV